MMKQNYLVVGANGTIGSALFNYFNDVQAPVWGTSQRQSDQPNIFYLNMLDDQHTLPNVNFDVIYLCAGVCRMALCEVNPEQTAQINIAGTLRLIDLFSKAGAHIVFLSTNQVFSGNKPHVKSDEPYSPLNEYGKQKVVVEEYIQQHCASWAIVRLTKVVEPNMSLVANWLQQLHAQQTIDAFTDMMLAPISLNWTVEMLVAIGQCKLTGIFQLSGTEDVSYAQLATLLANTIGVSTDLINPVSALDKGIPANFLPKFTSLDSFELKTKLNTHPPSLSQVLEDNFLISA